MGGGFGKERSGPPTPGWKLGQEICRERGVEGVGERRNGLLRLSNQSCKSETTFKKKKKS